MEEKVLFFEKSARHRFYEPWFCTFLCKWYRGVQRNTNWHAWEILWGLEVTFLGFAPVCTFLIFFAPICARFAHFLRGLFELCGSCKKCSSLENCTHLMTSSGSDKSRQQAEEFFKCAVVSKSARFAKLCSGHIFTSRKCDLGDDLLI